MAVTDAWYFAYGSNMDPQRLDERRVEFTERQAGLLSGWRLVFDKRSKNDPTIGFANIVRDADFVVEGILYCLGPVGLERLDQFEKTPEHYERVVLEIASDRGHVDAWVYVATDEWRSPGLRVDPGYLQRLVTGSDLLGKEYREHLDALLEQARADDGAAPR